MVRRVDDHSSWVGKAPKGCVFPDGVKKKQFKSADGAGDLMDYDQTSENIMRYQNKTEKKVNAQKHQRPDRH